MSEPDCKVPRTLPPALGLLTESESLTALRQAYATGPQQRVLAFYSSELGGTTRDPAFFTVPIDDHQVHRGHAVFDTCNVEDGFARGLDAHLDRLLESAASARIAPVPDKAELKRVVLETIAVSDAREAYARFWLSAGRGDFGVATARCKPGRVGFYVVVHEYDSVAKQAAIERGVAEVTVSIPPKAPVMLTSTKTTNYLINALVAMEALDRGGHLGLQLDEKGLVAETSVGSVAFLGHDGVLRTPKLDRVLRSLTVERARELYLARREVVPQLTDFAYCDIRPDDACVREPVEMLALGGGHVVAVVKFDGRAVGDGRPGPVARALDTLLTNDDASREAVPYHAATTSRDRS